MDDIKITNDPYYVCDPCEKLYTTKSGLENHIKTHKDNVCYRCRKKFNQKSSLDTHLKSNSCEKMYACEFCEKTFSKMHELTRHIIINHEEARNYVCNICQKDFYLKHTAKVHIKVCHSIEQNVACDFCGQELKNKDELKEHIKKHCKEIVNESNVANTSFSDGKDVLNNSFDVSDTSFMDEKDFQIKLCRADKKPHICNVCHKAFAYKSYLTRHYKRHASKDKPNKNYKKQKVKK